jgi:hypothetical protein
MVIGMITPLRIFGWCRSKFDKGNPMGTYLEQRRKHKQSTNSAGQYSEFHHSGNGVDTRMMGNIQTSVTRKAGQGRKDDGAACLLYGSMGIPIRAIQDVMTEVDATSDHDPHNGRKHDDIYEVEFDLE